VSKDARSVKGCSGYAARAGRAALDRLPWYMLAVLLVVPPLLLGGRSASSALTYSAPQTVASGTDASSYSTASWTPTAGDLLLAFVSSTFSGGTPNTPTVSGNGLTWSQAATYAHDTSGTEGRLTLLVAVATSPTAGVTTASFGGQTQLSGQMHIIAVAGADTSGGALAAIVQTVTGAVNASATSGSLTYAALGNTSNGIVSAFWHQANETTTPGTGDTELADTGQAGPSGNMETQYETNATAAGGTWTTSAGWGALGAEVKALVSTPTPTPTPTGTATPTATATASPSCSTIATPTTPPGTSTPGPFTDQQGAALLSCLSTLTATASTSYAAFEFVPVLVLLVLSSSFGTLLAVLIIGRTT